MSCTGTTAIRLPFGMPHTSTLGTPISDRLRARRTARGRVVAALPSPAEKRRSPRLWRLSLHRFGRHCTRVGPGDRSPSLACEGGGYASRKA